jgi:cytochrome c553
MLSRSLLPVLLLVSSAAGADDDLFEKSVRPVLVEKCVGCHAKAKAKGGLRLDSRDGLLKGGDSGAAVVPGKAKDSPLIQALNHVGDVKMPPSGKLADREIAAITEWVNRGAPWPKDAVLAAPDAIAAAAAKHWAFQPVKRPAGANSIDGFIRKSLNDNGLSLSPRADNRTLIRRATFDLHGLPPTPAEIDAFLQDDSPNAYEKLLDRLLASPRYGERQARAWLDVARYADNKGYVFFEGKEYPWAWTYRDYVIEAFNADTPFDRFVQEQLAADQIENADPKSLAALGFLTVGGHFMNNTHDILDDRIDTVTRGLLGLTVSCARCHDHKFDPIPAADYYSLYGVFRSATEPMVPPVWGKAPDTGEQQMYDAELKIREKKLVDFVTAKHAGLVNGARMRIAEYLLAAHAARNAPPADDFMLLADPGDLNPSMITRFRQHLDDARKKKDPVWAHWHAYSDHDFAKGELKIDGGNRLIREAFTLPPKSMKEVAERYAKAFSAVPANPKPAENPALMELHRVLYGPTSPCDAPLALDWGFLSLFPDRATQGEYQKWLRELETWLAKGPPRAMSLVDTRYPYEPRVFERGNPGRPGEAVPRQMPKIANPDRKPFAPGSGRLELAKQIASKSNPLTARVFVNRVWMQHFGKPLVGTPGDFGLRSDPPTHPELLDWLAVEFMNGWGIKRLHKSIMMTDAYTQQSLDRPEALAKDSENRLLWKQNRRRLEFEALHDSLLATSGGLVNQIGGRPVPLPAANRRAVYGYVDRLEFPSLLTTFDVPNPAGSTPQRTATTVAPQSLFLMNGPFARAAAKRLAATTEKEKEAAKRIDALFLTLLGRRPDVDERAMSLAFTAKGPERWTDLIHGLMMSNEFLFVD